MNYQTLLESSSPTLAALEAKLGRAGQKLERAHKQGARLCADGKMRGYRIPLNPYELEEWFWKAAIRSETTGCWEWQWTKDIAGYGVFQNNKRHWRSIRFVATIILGTEPELDVLHVCDRPMCVNPSHLWLGTMNDNMRDKIDKGRTPKWEQHGIAKLTREEVLAIRSSAISGTALAALFNVSKSRISVIRNNQGWKGL